jgi:hypothetical protein
MEWSGIEFCIRAGPCICSHVAYQSAPLLGHQHFAAFAKVIMEPEGIHVSVVHNSAVE